MDLAHDVCDSPLDISWSSNAGAEYHVKEDHTADGQLYFGCHDLPNISPVRSDVLWHSSVRHKHVLKESARCLEYRDIEDNCSQTYCLMTAPISSRTIITLIWSIWRWPQYMWVMMICFQNVYVNISRILTAANKLVEGGHYAGGHVRWENDLGKPSK